MSKIIYTHTDEAPALATYSLLPLVKSIVKHADIDIEIKDISLANRIISQFSECLTDNRKCSDDLLALGKIIKKSDANIIKLPNISASIPQLISAISELQKKGYDIPEYISNPISKDDIENKEKYSKVLGSAVNPVLREGNSDRRVAKAVKTYAKNHPHSMGKWEKNSKTHVSNMMTGDFYANEKSTIMPENDSVKIQLTTDDGQIEILKDNLQLIKNEILDCTFMSKKELIKYYEKEIKNAKDSGILLSLHVKATMMKVSDPIIFGHAVAVYFKEVFVKHSEVFEKLGVNQTNGLGQVYDKIKSLDLEKQQEIIKDIENVYKINPDLAMVDSSKGITNLHVPSDIIIDASMAAMIRNAGKMWDKNNKVRDTKALIPDRCYSEIFQSAIEFCQKNETYDVTTMGSVANVGLMAKKAEEYGSHDKTFEISNDGIVDIINDKDEIILSQKVEKGDIFRACQTKDIAIKDWVKLAVNRAKATLCDTIFWLDENRAHDANMIAKVKEYLKSYDIKNLNIKILSPVKAMEYSLQAVKDGKDVISVTGNILRDYLTDLFPILELGTSAKMLSIVPLLDGGGLFETGAGGSAPKHVEQLISENHLRWDSLGEFLALAVSLEDLAVKTNNPKIKTICESLNKANDRFLKENKSPSRKVKEIDNRGSHFYLFKFWCEALANQTDNKDLQNKFIKISEELNNSENKINAELLEVQGKSVDIEGYFLPNVQKVMKIMRPSNTLNSIVNNI